MLLMIVNVHTEIFVFFVFIIACPYAVKNNKLLRNIHLTRAGTDFATGDFFIEPQHAELCRAFLGIPEQERAILVLAGLDNTHECAMALDGVDIWRGLVFIDFDADAIFSAQILEFRVFPKITFERIGG